MNSPVRNTVVRTPRKRSASRMSRAPRLEDPASKETKISRRSAGPRVRSGMRRDGVLASSPALVGARSTESDSPLSAEESRAEDPASERVVLSETTGGAESWDGSAGPDIPGEEESERAPTR